jgi:hypothetical protein
MPRLRELGAGKANGSRSLHMRCLRAAAGECAKQAAIASNALAPRRGIDTKVSARLNAEWRMLLDAANERRGTADGRAGTGTGRR